MANTTPNQLFDFNVTGTQELARNLALFGSPKTLERIINLSMRAGAMLPLRMARANARALGLGFIGFKPRNRRGDGESQGQSRRYGRIPPSLKVNRTFRPRGTNGDVYRLNVMARTQKKPGIYRNKAPHAHLVEYGYTHTHSQRKIEGRPFMGPALDQTAPQVVEVVAKRMQGLVDGLKFPVTGNGK